MTEARKHNFFWPTVATLEDAKKASRYGTGAAIIVAVVTAGVASWALLSKSTVVGFIDAWAYIDAVLFSAVAFGIYREKRFAAVAGLVLYVLEKAYQISVTGQLQGAVLTIILTIMFISSVRGTYALHRIRKAGGQQGAPADAPASRESPRAFGPRRG